MQKGHWVLLGALGVATLFLTEVVTHQVQPVVKTKDVVRVVVVTPTTVPSPTPFGRKVRVTVVPTATSAAVKK